jgi:hypothetical protein
MDWSRRKLLGLNVLVRDSISLNTVMQNMRKSSENLF